MLYELEVKNKTGENIYRANERFRGRRSEKVIVDEAGFKEIKACSTLVIEKLLFVCPHCKKVFDKKKGLFTHINMAHPEHARNFNKE